MRPDPNGFSRFTLDAIRILGAIRQIVWEPRTAAGILNLMLKATEQEHMFALMADDPDADTPSLTGVTIIGPGPTKADRQKVSGPAPPTRRWN